MERYLTVSEFAKLFRLDRNNVYELIRANEIPFYRIGKSYRLDIEDFREGGSNEKE